MDLYRVIRRLFGRETARDYLANAAIVAFAFFSVFAIGRVTGLVPVVAYELGSQSHPVRSAWENKPTWIGGPAFLNKGEKLVAQYDITIESGEVRFVIRKGSAPIGRERVETHSIEKSNIGRYEFVAPESGVYWPSSEFESETHLGKCENNKRGDSAVSRMIRRGRYCVALNASYSVLWGVEA